MALGGAIGLLLMFDLWADGSFAPCLRMHFEAIRVGDEPVSSR